MFIGLARSLGRICASDPPLLRRLFPRPEPPKPAETMCADLTKKRSFTTFRSIIPHSLSGNFSQSPLDAMGKNDQPEAIR